MIEFTVRQWNSEGEFVSDAMMGPSGLFREIEFMPKGWRMEIVRTVANPDPPSDSAQPEDFRE